MEKFFYEFRPYFYFALAFYAVVISHASWIMVVSGILLAISGYIVRRIRLEYRSIKPMQRAHG